MTSSALFGAFPPCLDGSADLIHQRIADNPTHVRPQRPTRTGRNGTVAVDQTHFGRMAALGRKEDIYPGERQLSPKPDDHMTGNRLNQTSAVGQKQPYD